VYIYLVLLKRKYISSISSNVWCTIRFLFVGYVWLYNKIIQNYSLA